MGKQIDTDVFTDESDDPLQICKNALIEAESKSFDVIIYDTAGRLNVDSEMMLEIQNFNDHLTPKEILYVADSMTGQDAVNVAKNFSEKNILPSKNSILT